MLDLPFLQDEGRWRTKLWPGVSACCVLGWQGFPTVSNKFLSSALPPHPTKFCLCMFLRSTNQTTVRGASNIIRNRYRVLLFPMMIMFVWYVVRPLVSLLIQSRFIPRVWPKHRRLRSIYTRRTLCTQSNKVISRNKLIPYKTEWPLFERKKNSSSKQNRSFGDFWARFYQQFNEWAEKYYRNLASCTDELLDQRKYHSELPKLKSHLGICTSVKVSWSKKTMRGNFPWREFERSRCCKFPPSVFDKFPKRSSKLESQMTDGLENESLVSSLREIFHVCRKTGHQSLWISTLSDGIRTQRSASKLHKVSLLRICIYPDSVRANYRGIPVRETFSDIFFHQIHNRIHDCGENGELLLVTW